jgi:hypothetical protein
VAHRCDLKSYLIRAFDFLYAPAVHDALKLFSAATTQFCRTTAKGRSIEHLFAVFVFLHVGDLEVDLSG